jgi:drug/metabolite transporter (DMT)-like permease
VAAHRWVGYVFVLLVGLLFLLWSPTQRASWVPAVVVMAILAVGYEVLLRQCAREHPEASLPGKAPPATPTGA